jgi:trehalose 6-phosphate phosphatase
LIDRHTRADRHDRVGGAEVQARLTTLLAVDGPILVVSDFDGTLARGSGDPAAAAIEPLARRSLRRLAALGADRPGRVRTAILTGRTALDAATRIRVGGIEYLGDHGLQSGWLPRGARPGSLTTAYQAGFERYVPLARALAAGVGSRLGHPAWLYIEAKGPSVAFHFRGAADRDAARDAVQAALRDTELEVGRHGLAHYRGRLVVDLRPVSAGGKREAMARLLARMSPAAVVAMGDDVSDADAFAVLRDAREGGSVDCLAVAVHGPHGMPDAVRDNADLHLASPHDASRLLASVARIVAVAAGGRASG